MTSLPFRQVERGQPRLFEDMRLTGSTPERLREVGVVGTAYDSVMFAGGFTYVSTPITSGAALYRAMDEAGVADPDELRRDKAFFSAKVIGPNIAAAEAVAQTMLALGGAVIAPAAFEARALGWGQDEYMGLWLDTIERKATRIAMTDGWEYSNGGAEEYLQALLMQAGRRDRNDIQVVDARGTPLSHLDALRLLESAVTNVMDRGFKPVTLATVLHRAALLHDMVGAEMDYGQSADMARRPHIQLSAHYLAALPNRDEWREHRRAACEIYERLRTVLPASELANRSSLAMAPGLVRAEGRIELEAQPAKLTLPKPQATLEAEDENQPRI